MLRTKSNRKEISVASGIGLLLVSTLLLWPVGLDQLFPPLLLCLYMLMYMVTQKVVPRFRLPKTSLLLLLFGLLFIASGLQVTSGTRVITFTRDLMTWATCILFYFHFYSLRTNGTLSGAAKPIFLFFLFVSATCFFHLAFPTFEFKSIGYLISPPSIAETMTGGRYLLKKFGEELYFFGFTARARSIFGSPIQLSCIIVLLIPFALAQ